MTAKNLGPYPQGTLKEMVETVPKNLGPNELGGWLSARIPPRSPINHAALRWNKPVRAVLADIEFHSRQLLALLEHGVPKSKAPHQHRCIEQLYDRTMDQLKAFEAFNECYSAKWQWTEEENEELRRYVMETLLEARPKGMK